MNMSRKVIIFVTACCLYGLLQAAPLNEKESRIIKARMVPAPQSINLTDGADVVLDKTLKV